MDEGEQEMGDMEEEVGSFNEGGPRPSLSEADSSEVLIVRFLHYQHS